MVNIIKISSPGQMIQPMMIFLCLLMIYDLLMISLMIQLMNTMMHREAILIKAVYARAKYHQGSLFTIVMIVELIQHVVCVHTVLMSVTIRIIMLVYISLMVTLYAIAVMHPPGRNLSIVSLIT